MFYSEESFQYEKELGLNYIEEDMNQTVILYEVDLTQTKVDDTYGETDPKSVVTKPPVEIHCVYKIDEPELKAYDKQKSLGTYQKTRKTNYRCLPRYTR